MWHTNARLYIDKPTRAVRTLAWNEASSRCGSRTRMTCRTCGAKRTCGEGGAAARREPSVVGNEAEPGQLRAHVVSLVKSATSGAHCRGLADRRRTDWTAARRLNSRVL